MKKSVLTAGIVIIGIAGLLFAFGDLLIPQEGALFEADKNPQAFAQLVTSGNYRIWALRGFMGVIMEMIGIVCLYEILAHTSQKKLAFYGLLTTLMHHVTGFGVFAVAYFMFPIIGHEINNGNTTISSAAAMTGALGLLMMTSLLITMIGNGIMAIAVWRSNVLPKWSGIMVFLGFLLLPLPGLALQFSANMLWAAAYFWMALSYWKVKNN